MQGGTTQEKIVYWLFADRIPLTKLLIISNVVTFLVVSFLGGKPGPLEYLSFTSSSLVDAPWSVFTYPLIAKCCLVFYLLFACYWLWVAGGSLERSWGTRRFGIYFFVMSAVSALGLLAGGKLSGVETVEIGLWLPLAGVTIAFAMINPEDEVLFFFLVRLKLKYLALADVVVVLASYARDYNITVAFFALAGCAFSYRYVRSGRRIGYRAGRYEGGGRVIRLFRKRGFLRRLSPLWWYSQYRERKRLKDFFDRSGFGE